MRKLKLQMNILLDNKWSKDMSDFSIENLKNVDCILHGRKTAESFIPYWTEIGNNPADNEYQLGKRFVEIPHVIFSNTLKESKWDNATIIKGDIVEAINDLKSKNGKDILVYGGNSFVSSLMQHNLIDEYYVMTNPASLGDGSQTFNPLKNDLDLKLVKCKPFSCGTVMLCYVRRH